MHSGGLMEHMGESKCVTFKDLEREFKSIKKDIRIIEEMEISEELKPPILAELQTQINEVKEKMHDFIDAM